MTTTTTSPLTEELDREHRRWLRLNEYDTVEAWAKDSDYHVGGHDLWVDDDGNPVDITAALLGAIEAQTTQYEVTVSNAFDAIDQADAVEQMIAWLVDQAAVAGYRWERIDDPPRTHMGQALPNETGFLDAEDLDR